MTRGSYSGDLVVIRNGDFLLTNQLDKLGAPLMATTIDSAQPVGPTVKRYAIVKGFSHVSIGIPIDRANDVLVSQVALGSCPPRTPTDPDVRVDASGSSEIRFAAGLGRPSVRLGRPEVDTA